MGEPQKAECQGLIKRASQVGLACLITGANAAVAGAMMGAPFGLVGSMLESKDLSMNGFRKHLTNAGATALRFGSTGGVFSAVDCLVSNIRGKRDIYSGLIAGSITGYTLNIRHGQKDALKAGATFGGLTFASDLLSVGLQRLAAQAAPPPPPPPPKRRGLAALLGGLGE
ncbi:putative Tim17 protein family member [Paratrimastix pyriformis]|uniref:Mitochondrial import inner membrane translocase subunit TIM22 n=1 Tax=Paratrimastix pyriformis TaxID=342808 RepID=M4QSK9_9EUKA|nr:Tim17 protein family member [Paratrimastix pyriformis]KAJ4462820.1 putative Tim17 protein family member [Paratrimastix pyriformis]